MKTYSQLTVAQQRTVMQQGADSLLQEMAEHYLRGGATPRPSWIVDTTGYDYLLENCQATRLSVYSFISRAWNAFQDGIVAETTARAAAASYMDPTDKIEPPVEGEPLAPDIE